MQVNPELVAVDIRPPPATTPRPGPEPAELRCRCEIAQAHGVVAHFGKAVDDTVHNVVGVGAFACGEEGEEDERVVRVGVRGAEETEAAD